MVCDMLLYVDVTWDNGIEGVDFEELEIDSYNECDILKAIGERFGRYVVESYLVGSSIVINSKFYGVVNIYY